MAKRSEFGQVDSFVGRDIQTPGRSYVDSGAEASAVKAAQIFYDIGKSLDDDQARQVTKEAFSNGITAGMQQDFRLRTDDTLAAEAYNEAGVKSYRLGLEIRVRDSLESIYQANSANPGALQEALGEYYSTVRNEVSSQIPEVAPALDDIYSRTSAPYVRAATEAHRAIIADQNKAQAFELGQKMLISSQRTALVGGDPVIAAANIAADRTAFIQMWGEHGPAEGMEIGGIKIPADPARISSMTAEQIQQIVHRYDVSVAEAQVRGKFDRAPNKQAWLDQFEASEKANNNSRFSLDQLDSMVSGFQSDINADGAKYNSDLAVADKIVDEYMKVVEGGGTPTNEVQVARMVSNYPELQPKFDMVKEWGKQFMLFADLSVAEQRDFMAALPKKDINSSYILEVRAKFDKMHQEKIAAEKADPIRAIVSTRTGSQFVPNIKPIELERDAEGNILGISGPAYAELIQTRLSLRTYTGQKGHQTDGFNNDEFAIIKADLDSTIGPEKVSKLKTIRAAYDDDVESYMAFISRFNKTDPALAVAGDIDIDPEMSEMIILGSSLLKDKAVDMPEDAIIRPDFDEHVGNAFAGNSGAKAAMFEAYKASLAADMDRKGLNKDSATDNAQDILDKLVPIDEFGTTKVVLPAGVDIDQFRDQLNIAATRAFTARIADPRLRDLYIGKMNSEDGIGLINIGDGTGKQLYMITDGNMGVVNDDAGRPFIIDLKEGFMTPDELAEHESRVRGGIGEAINMSRPILRNEDGTMSTEETITISADIGAGEQWYNIPTIIDGVRVSDQDAIDKFRMGINPHVGIFSTQESAVESAKKRSEAIGKVRE